MVSRNISLGQRADEEVVFNDGAVGTPKEFSDLDIVVTSVASDAHTWNLVYIQLLLEECGHRVRNLGACVSAEYLIAACVWRRPALIVVSTINGHGFTDGLRMITRVREQPDLAMVPAVIGGKLGVAGPAGNEPLAELLAAGFDAVFQDAAAPNALRAFVRQLSAPVEK